MTVKCPICDRLHNLNRYPQDCRWHLGIRYTIAGGATHDAKTPIDQILEVNPELTRPDIEEELGKDRLDPRGMPSSRSHLW